MVALAEGLTINLPSPRRLTGLGWRAEKKVSLMDLVIKHNAQERTEFLGYCSHFRLIGVALD